MQSLMTRPKFFTSCCSSQSVEIFVSHILVPCKINDCIAPIDLKGSRHRLGEKVVVDRGPNVEAFHLLDQWQRPLDFTTLLHLLVATLQISTGPASSSIFRPAHSSPTHLRNKENKAQPRCQNSRQTIRLTSRQSPQ